MQEVWKDVVGFEQYFKVSNLGDVVGKRSGQLIRPHTNSQGYKTFYTQLEGRDGPRHCFRVNRLVADAFLEPPSEELVAECSGTVYGVVVVRHINDIKTDNRADNLAWGTYQDNVDDFKKSEKYLERLGRNTNKSRLSLHQVEEIKKRYVAKCKVNGQAALAAEFGVGCLAISRICRGLTYK